MPPLPDRSGRALPDARRRRRHRWRLCRASTPLASWPGGAWRSPCSRPTRSAGAPRPATAASSMPATSGAPASSSRRYGADTGKRALPGDARLVPAGQAAHRRRGHRLRLPRGRPPRAGLRAVARPGARPRPRQPGLRRRRRLRRAPRADPRGDRHRRVLRRARRRGQRPAPSGQVLRRAGRGGRRAPAPTSTRASGPARSGARPMAASSSRRRAARSWPATCSWPRTATRTASCPSLRRRIMGIGSFIIAVRAAARGPRPRAVAQGPLVLRHQELPVLLARVAGPPDDLRRPRLVPADVDRQDRPDPVEGPARGPSAAGRLPHRVRLGRQRRVHLRPDAARRADEGRRDLRPGLLRDRRRADDLPRARGSGEWLAGGEAPALTKLTFPLVPAPYEGRPWFLPFVGEWYRLQDRLAARSRGEG